MVVSSERVGLMHPVDRVSGKSFNYFRTDMLTCSRTNKRDRTLTPRVYERIFAVSSTARRCMNSMTPPGMFGVVDPLGIGSDPQQSKH